MLGKLNTPQIKNRELQNKLNLFMHRYFGVLVFVIVLFLLYIGFVYIIKPKNESVSINSEVMIADKQSEKRMLEGVLEKLISYRLAYDNIGQAEKEKINSIVPDTEGRENLFSNLEAFILRQGLILNSIEINTKEINPINSRQRQEEDEAVSVTSGGGVENINLTIEIGGVNNYERFKEFLLAIEKNMRLIDITDINYDQSAGTISIEATTYYIKSDE